jgi:hypothetical protein
MDTFHQPRWLRRTIQIVGVLAILDGAFRLTNLLQAHTSGCNRFELYDALELLASTSYLAAGYGTMLLKNWGRFLLMICYLFRMITKAGSFYQVLRVIPQKPDVLGWALAGLLVSLPFGLILLLWLGWRKMEFSNPIILSRKWRNFAAVSLVIGVGTSLMERIDFGEEVKSHPDLDASFLRRTGRRTFYKATNGSELHGRLGWRISIREQDGKIEVYPLPPGGDCLARLDPKTGAFSLHGFVFSGEPYEAAPTMIGRKKLRGLSFSRSRGAISGKITFGEDVGRNLYMFFINFSVYGKQYDGIYFSPMNNASDPR